MGDKVKPPKLPPKAPKELSKFLDCKLMEVDLDPTQAGWIPKPGFVPDGLAPSVTVTPNGANSVTVAVGWGYLSLTLPVTVSGGQLQVDATNLPGKQGIDDWVKSFNDFLKENGYDLAGLEIKNGKIHLTKRLIPATQPSTTTPPPTTPKTETPKATPTPTPTPQTTPTPAPGEGGSGKAKVPGGCVLFILMALILLFGATVAYFVTRDDDGNTSSNAKPPTVDSGSTTTLEPLNEALICARLEVVQHVLDDFGATDPCEIDPLDFWEACYDYMPCFNSLIPLITLSSTVGISHNGSVADAENGQTGPSQAEHLVLPIGPLFDLGAWIDAVSRCGSNTITGRSNLMPTGSTSIKHPLYNFGQCSTDLWYQGASIRQLLGSYDFNVTGTPVDPVEPVTTGITVPTETSLNAVGTTLGLLGGKALDPACTWYTANSAALRFDQCHDYWSFNAAYNDPRVVSYGAGFINPLGTASPTQDQITSFGASRLFGKGTYFPCGPGNLGYTACPTGQADVQTSFFIAGTVSMSQRLDEVPDGTYVQVGAEDYWLRLLRIGNTWTLTSSEGDDSQGRAILRGNAITFMMPFNEPAAPDLTYTVSVGDSTGAIDQPPQPVLGRLTSTQGPETPSDFFAKLSNSISSGDLTYALGRLHPLVIQAFSADLCSTELSLRVTPNYLITVDSVGETAPWKWELPDGRSFDVEEATTVTIRLPDVADPVEAHIVNIDQDYYWFTICDAR